MCRDEVSRQIAGFKQEWFGRMHRIDKFFHRVRPPPGAKMSTHKGATPALPAPSFPAESYSLYADPILMSACVSAGPPAVWTVTIAS